MLLLDITVVNVALPDIQRDPDTRLSSLQCVVDAHALLPDAPSSLAEAVSAGGGCAAAEVAPPGNRAQIAEAANEAFVSGLNDILLVGAAIAIAGGVIGFALVRSRDFFEHPGADAAVEPSIPPRAATREAES